MAKYLLALIILFLFPVNTALAVYDLDKQDKLERYKIVDQRVEILRSYLDKHNSPMRDSATDFIEAADKYDLDWKLVPAIAGVESTFGKHVPGGDEPKYTSYNAWGWGVYGTQAIYFKSWRDGIFTVSEGLRKNYLDKGLKDPYSVNRVYAASPFWGSRVSFFLSDISLYEIEYNQRYPIDHTRLSLVTQLNVNNSSLALK